MIKFYKVKDTEIRKVADVAEDGSMKVIAIIGQVRELASRDIIRDVQDFNRVADKWMVIPADIDTEGQRADAVYDSLLEAKQSFK